MIIGQGWLNGIIILLLIRGGINVTDKDGNVVGGISGKRSPGNYTAAKRAYSKAQLEMRHIRREAEANGVKIVVSQWENMPIKPGVFDPY